MPMDQQPSGCNHIPEQEHAKLSYDGTGERVKSAALRRTAPVVVPSKLEIVSESREARAGEHR